MNKKLLIISVSLITIAWMAWVFEYEGSQIALEERFPQVDPKIIRKVHKEIIREAFQGKHRDISEEEKYDQIFWEKVNKITGGEMSWQEQSTLKI